MTDGKETHGSVMWCPMCYGEDPTCIGNKCAWWVGGDYSDCSIRVMGKCANHVFKGALRKYALGTTVVEWGFTNRVGVGYGYVGHCSHCGYPVISKQAEDCEAVRLAEYLVSSKRHCQGCGAQIVGYDKPIGYGEDN